NRIDDEQTKYLEEIIHAWVAAYPGDGWKKFGVKNNGLNLVLMYLVEELRLADHKEEIGS
ncbi:hypothetical protein, partial [Bacillus safensis]|uniref:hypothetical protein n=1 Tax=Bacillus safensis TaxID=561879 RepID=UPI002FFE991B